MLITFKEDDRDVEIDTQVTSCTCNGKGLAVTVSPLDDNIAPKDFMMYLLQHPEIYTYEPVCNDDDDLVSLVVSWDCIRRIEI